MSAHTRHTDREYEAELQALKDKLLLMAGHVEKMIHDAVQAISTRNGELARRTVLCDRAVNRLERSIDEDCLLILAKRHPMASDLRFVTLALKMVVDLERIGDLAVNVCERAIDLAPFPPLVPTTDLETLAGHVIAMVKDAMDAFVARDAERAHHVIAQDDQVDEGYHQFFRSVLSLMRSGPDDAVERGIHLQSVAKFLERMADHATNVAEQVIFWVEGTDVRHAGKLESAPEPP